MAPHANAESMIQLKTIKIDDTGQTVTQNRNGKGPAAATLETGGELKQEHEKQIRTYSECNSPDLKSDRILEQQRRVNAALTDYEEMPEFFITLSLYGNPINVVSTSAVVLQPPST